MATELPQGNWRLYKNGVEHSALHVDTLKTLLSRGTLSPTDLVWYPGLPNWTPLGEVLSNRASADPKVAKLELNKEVSRNKSESSKTVPADEQKTRSDALPPQPQHNTSAETGLAPVAAPNSPLDQPDQSRLKGRIKFLDVKTKTWGFIISETGENIHYYIEAFGGHYDVDDLTADVEVTFEVGTDSKVGRPTARNIQIPNYARASRLESQTKLEIERELDRSDEAFSHKKRDLRKWAFIPAGIPHNYNRHEYKNVYDALKNLCLPEKWQLGKNERENKKWPLLQIYLYYTFERLRREDEEKIFYKEQDGKKWAVFNTGLVDRVYDPIYMLFTEHPQFNHSDAYPPWKIWNICTYGQKDEGQRLSNLFKKDECPPAATYLKDTSDLIIPPGEVPVFDEEHVIYDAIEDDRYPPEFLRRFAPHDFEWEDYSLFEDARKKGAFLKRYRELLERVDKNTSRRRELLNRIKDAAAAASKRTFWNYKTAIPSYYPKFNQISLLLPLCLDDRDDAKVTVALVVSKTKSGSYTAWTVFPLQWAYERARVVCRPDSDWLIPELIDPRGKISSKEGDVDAE